MVDQVLDDIADLIVDDRPEGEDLVQSVSQDFHFRKNGLILPELPLTAEEIAAIRSSWANS
jgi:hypothetical protein